MHQDSQIIFTKLFFRWLALHQPHQKLGFFGCTCRVLEKIQLIFLLVSGAVQCADLVTATSHGDTDPFAAYGQSPSPTKRSQMCRNSFSPRSLVQRDVSDVLGIVPPGDSGNCSLLSVSTIGEPSGKFLVSLWAPIAVSAACCCSVLVVHTGTNMACS